MLKSQCLALLTGCHQRNSKPALVKVPRCSLIEAGQMNARLRCRFHVPASADTERQVSCSIEQEMRICGTSDAAFQLLRHYLQDSATIGDILGHAFEHDSSF